MPDQISQEASARMPLAADPLRKDAQRNRDRLVEAARDIFTTRGMDAPLSSIARRAGVGVATLYRRFPTRASLVATVFDDQLAACAVALDAGLADPDPWLGFCSFVEAVCAAQMSDHGFTSAFLAQYQETDDARERRDRVQPDLVVLIQRAKDAGRLRQDFEPSDVLLILLANNGLAAQPPRVAEPASRRLVSLFLQSVQADRTTALPPPPPLDLDQVRQAAPPRRQFS